MTREPLGYGQIVALAGVKDLTNVTGGIPTGANLAVLQAETQSVRWRDDGDAPTATDGMLLVAGENPVEYIGPMTAIRFFEATAGAILHVSFYKV